MTEYGHAPSEAMNPDTYYSQRDTSRHWPPDSWPKKGEDIGGGRIALMFKPIHDGDAHGYAYGQVLCVWRGQFVIWSMCIWRDDDERYVTEHGSYYQSLTEAVEDWGTRQ